MNTMLKFLIAASTAGLLVACSDQAKQDTAETAPSENTQVVVGLDDNLPPMGFRDEQNNIIGFDIDMAKEATKRSGLSVTFKPIDWSAKESELKSKRIDMLWNGLTITEERKQNILFSEPYMENHQIIVVSSGSNIQHKADLQGKTVGIQDGSSAVDAVESDPVGKSFKELKKYADNVTALLDLANKRVDAVVVDEVVGRYYVAKKPQEYTVLDDNFGTEEYGVGFRKDDVQLQQKIQAALNDMKADGTSAKIATKWFGKDIIK